MVYEDEPDGPDRLRARLARVLARGGEDTLIEEIAVITNEVVPDEPDRVEHCDALWTLIGSLFEMFEHVDNIELKVAYGDLLLGALLVETCLYRREGCDLIEVLEARRTVCQDHPDRYCGDQDRLEQRISPLLGEAPPGASKSESELWTALDELESIAGSLKTRIPGRDPAAAALLRSSLRGAIATFQGWLAEPPHGEVP